jgi:CBS domain-containing protein
VIQEFLNSTQLKDFMASPPITVNEGDEFHVVQDKFATYDIRHLPVVNDAGCVVGLISQRHLYKLHSPRLLEDGSWYYDKDMLDSFILKNVMVKDPYMLKAGNTLKEALDAMAQHKFGCIPIVDEYRLPVGIITRSDILKFFLNHA